MSSSILDAAIGRIGGPDIISEQHDVNQIAVGAVAPSGLASDGIRRQIANVRSSWDAAECGISADAQVAKLEESLAKTLAFEATPEGQAAAKAEAERALVEMRQRAIQ